MIIIFPYEALGAMDISWLKARYHFSFSNYYNPSRMSFGALRVINDDVVKVGGGFDFHSHKNMEIITYVRRGAITHRDNLGNEGKTQAGDIQVMSAGTGITHAEHNQETVDTHLYQIWIEPHTKDVEPRWETHSFDKTPVSTSLNLMVSGLPEHAGRHENLLHIHAHAAIYGGVLKSNTDLTQPLAGNAYLLVSEGQVEVHGKAMKTGDGAEISDETSLHIHAKTDAELVLIELAP